VKAMRSLAALACVVAGLGGCASESPQRATYVPVVAGDAEGLSQLSRDVTVAFSDGESHTLPAGSRWRRVGALVQGDVYRPLGEPLRTGRGGGSEAYLVVSSGRLQGFYLPAGSLFKPLSKPVPLPFSQRQ